MRFTALILIATLIPLLTQAAQNKIKAAAGIELGGNGTFMFSDQSVQIFAAGAGLQGSVFYSMWNDRPIGAKLRFENLLLQEGALQRSATDYIYPGTVLKSMAQSWNIISVGAEGRFNYQNQSMFWEAMLGYAMGSWGSMTSSFSNTDQGAYVTGQSVSSALVLAGGAGIKRAFTDYITGMVSLRTFFLLSPIYSSTTLNQKTLIPLPFLFNVGIEVPFEI